MSRDYWADPLPAIDSSLCAVIDPIRDFRWHALHCGGPETASFLCEMEVPEWISDCMVRAMPQLTIQYMSESATVELFRDCGESDGIKHMTCRGKQDVSFIQTELMCSSDSTNGNAENNNGLVNVKSSQIEEKIVVETSIVDQFPSKNDENNSIDMMMGDQPIEDVSTKAAESTTAQQTTLNDGRTRRDTTDSVSTTQASFSTIAINVNESKAEQIDPSSVANQNHTQESTSTTATTTQANSTMLPSVSESTVVAPSTDGNDTVTVPSSTSEDISSAVTTTTAATVVQQYENGFGSETRKTNMMRPHAPKFAGEIMYHAPIIVTSTVIPPPAEVLIDGNSTGIKIESNSTDATSTIVISENPVNATTKIPTTVITSNGTTLESNGSISIAESIPLPEKRSSNQGHKLNSNKHPKNEHGHDQGHDHDHGHGHDHHQQHPGDAKHEHHVDFSNSELDFQRYKPNRRRVITKPETHTYIQKIFG